jgi:hypothetical protein
MSEIAAHLHSALGRVRRHADPDSWAGLSGNLLVIPSARHSVQALEESVVLLTIVKKPPVIGKGAQP